MTKFLMLLSALLFICILVGMQPAAAKDLSCPTATSPDQITAWRDSAFQTLLNGNYSQVLSGTRECFGSELPECLKDLRYYAEYLRGPRLNTPKLTELYDQSLIDRDETVLPEEFRAKDASGKRREGYVQIPADLFDLAKNKGWKTTNFKTRSLGGFDASHNLLIMLIPGQKKDVVMMVTIDENANPARDIVEPNPNPPSQNFTKGHNTMTLIIVDKGANSLSKRARMKHPPTAQLRSLKLADKDLNQYQWINKGGASTSCYNCHTMPTMAISPVGYKVQNGAERAMSPDKAQTVSAINDILTLPTSWGSIKTEGREVRFGPPIDSQPLGWAPKDSPTRSQAFIEKCAAERKPLHHTSRDAGLYKHVIEPNPDAPIRWKMIRDSMNCIECHDGTLRGIVHDRLNDSFVAYKVAVEKSMPAGPDKFDLSPPLLTDDERLALLRCLEKEREVVEPDWKRSGWWVKRVQCEDAARSRPQTDKPSNAVH